MMPAGSVNAWKCRQCGRLTVAVHVDAGVTPFLLQCRSTPGCHGMAVSSGYPPEPIPEHITAAIAWEWRRATSTQMKRYRREAPEMYRHCQMGGLVIAPRGRP